MQTARGPVVIASDALHFYANDRTGNPFPIIFDLGAMTQGWRISKRLAGGDESRVIAGHDPEVRARFQPVEGQDGEVVALHLPPLRLNPSPGRGYRRLQRAITTAVRNSPITASAMARPGQ